MANEIINPDDFGKVLDKDVESLSSNREGVGALTPDNMAGLFDEAITSGISRTNDLAVQTALIQSKGTDIEAINLASADIDATTSLAKASEDLFVSLEQELRDMGGALQDVNPAQYAQGLDALVAGQQGINAMRASPVAVEEAVIRGSVTTNLADAIRTELSFNLGARNEVAALMDEASIWDKLSDFGGNFIPFRDSVDLSDVQANVGSHPDLKGIISGDSIPNMVGTWQALPASRKKALFPALKEAVLNATGVGYGVFESDANIANASAILLRFLQPEGGERAEFERNAFAALDVAGFLPVGAIARGAKALVKGGKAVDSTLAGARLAKITKLSPQVRADMEGILANAGDYLRRTTNPVKIVADAGDTTQAAKMNVVAMGDENIAKAYGLPSDGAYRNAIPQEATVSNPEFVEGLAPATAELLNDFARTQAGFARSMTDESGAVFRGATSNSDRKLVVQNFEQQMADKGEDLLQEGISLSNVKVLEDTIDESGFVYEYVIQNTKHLELEQAGELINVKPKTHRAFRSWKINEVTGNFDETVTSLKGTTAPGVSPSAWSVTKAGDQLDFNDSLKQALVLEGSAVARKKSINEQWLAANADISGLRDAKARARIESIEIAGDEFINKGTTNKGKVFSEMELLAGVKTAGGIVRLTKPNEVAAYYKRRMFADSLWGIQNQVTRRELQLGGFTSSVRLKGQNLAVKTFDTPEAAALSASKNPGMKAYVKELDGTVDITGDELAKQYGNGKVLVRSRNDWNTSGAGDLARGGEFVEYVFIDSKKLRPLPGQVLHYKNGYVPKINEGVEFIVKRKLPVNKAGVKGATNDSALRAFSSRQDANTFINQQIGAIMAKNPGKTFDEIAPLFDIADGSAMGQLERMESALSGTGGLFTGTRSADDLMMGLDGVPIQRVSPTESFGRYVDHLGQKTSHNEWRIGQEQQWLNTVRKVDSSIQLEGFGGTKLPNTPEGKALGRLRDQISTWNRVPSGQESLYEGVVQKYHDFVLNGVRRLGIQKNAINHALYLKHVDPVAMAMTANMHVFLGALNPAQIYVQASAMTVALSLNKISDIPGIITKAVKWGALDNMNNPAALQKNLDKLRRGGDIDANGIEMYNAWRKSGLLESVRTNADIGYMSTTGVGVTQDVLRKAGNVSLMFYRTGELANRRVSFISAYTRWKAKNPNKAVGNSEVLDITQDANLTMLELGSANKAWWQGGAGASAPQRIASLSTQFLQVLGKTAELSVKGTKRGGFTNAQKRRIAAGQLIFFGAAGVPLLNVVVPGILDQINYTPDNAVVAAVNQGLTGTIVHNLVGADVDVANRASLFAGVGELIGDVFTSKDPMWAKALSLTGITGQRVGQAALGTSELIQSQMLGTLSEVSPLLLHDRSGETEMDTPTMLQTTRDIATLIATTVPTSGRNALKAYIMYNHGKVFDRRGRVVLDEEQGEFSLADVFGVGLGFQLDRETTTRIVQNHQRDQDELINESAQTIVAAYHRYVYTHDMAAEYAGSVTNVVQLVHESLDDPWLIEQVTNKVERSIFTDPQSTEARGMKKFFDRILPEKLSEGVLLDTSINFGNITDRQAIVQPLKNVLEEEGR